MNQITRILCLALLVLPSLASANKGVELMHELQRAVSANVTSLGACRIHVAEDDRKYQGRALHLECVGDPSYDAQIIQSVAQVDTTAVPRYATKVWAPGWRNALSSRMNEVRAQVVPLQGDGRAHESRDVADAPASTSIGSRSAPPSTADKPNPFELASRAAERQVAEPRPAPRNTASIPAPSSRAPSSRPTAMRDHGQPRRTLRSSNHPLRDAITDLGNGRVALAATDYRRLNCEYRAGRSAPQAARLARRLAAYPSNIERLPVRSSHVSVDRDRISMLLDAAAESRRLWPHEGFSVDDACAAI